MRSPWEKTLPIVVLAVVGLLVAQVLSLRTEEKPGQIYLHTVPTGARIYMLQAGSVAGFHRKLLAHSPGPLPVSIKERTRFTFNIELFGYHAEEALIGRKELEEGATIVLEPRWGLLSAFIYLVRDFKYLLTALLLSCLYWFGVMRPQLRGRRVQQALWDSGQTQVGMLLHDFRLLEKLGEGAAGTVFKADKPGSKSGEIFTLKIFLRGEDKDSSDLERALNQELKSCTLLAHPGIVYLHGWGVFRDYYYLVSEYVSGVTLDQVPHPSLAQVCEWGLQLVDALSYAHSQGVVHRDIKPANIMRTEDNRVKILDFGIAARSDSDEESGAGSIGYMAPEQAGGKVGAAGDFYSLGVTLYRLASGQLPFRGEDYFQVLASQAVGNYKPLRSLVEDCPPELNELIDGLLRKDPTQRPEASRILNLLQASVSRLI